jgi:hypothetical protein
MKRTFSNKTEMDKYLSEQTDKICPVGLKSAPGPFGFLHCMRDRCMWFEMPEITQHLDGSYTVIDGYCRGAKKFG